MLSSHLPPEINNINKCKTTEVIYTHSKTCNQPVNIHGRRLDIVRDVQEIGRVVLIIHHVHDRHRCGITTVRDVSAK